MFRGLIGFFFLLGLKDVVLGVGRVLRLKWVFFSIFLYGCVLDSVFLSFLLLMIWFFLKLMRSILFGCKCYLWVICLFGMGRILILEVKMR